MENRDGDRDHATQPARQPRTPMPLNGVDTPTLFATLDAVRQQPELARFQFRATNRWQQGTHSRSRMESFHGAGGEQKHVREFTFDADHPQVLVGRDHGPTPVEFLLHALAACITGGDRQHRRGARRHAYEVESTVEGDIDLRGILGLSDGGPQRLRADPGEPPNQGRRLAGDARARSWSSPGPGPPCTTS